jgi:roadblock/LC7 domain-containing protein
MTTTENTDHRIGDNPRLAAYVADLKAEQRHLQDEMAAANVIRFDQIATSAARKRALDLVRQLAARLEGLEYALAALDDHGIYGA